jgi:condensation enzyme
MRRADPAIAAPAGGKPLSWSQEHLCALDRGDNAGGLSQWYTITCGLRLTGDVDVAALQAALDDVVARHEILRTHLVREATGWYQRIDDPAPVQLALRDGPPVPADSRDRAAQDLINELEARPFPVRSMPLLRAQLARLGNRDYVLALATHHIAADAWSMQVIIRDLAALYARRRGEGGPALAPAFQYRQFAVWQRGASTAANLAASRYWRDRLDGGEMLALPASRVPPPGAPEPYSVGRFVIDTELGRSTTRLATSARSSLFVVLLAAYNVLASRLTGGSDLVVPTYSAGRQLPGCHDGVGPYYNLLPIRTDISGCRSFLDIVARTRASCLGAYQNDIPFPCIEAEAPGLMGRCADETRAMAAFEMIPPGIQQGHAADVRYCEIRRRVVSQQIGASTPQGLLWALDRLPTGEIAATMRFSRARFEPSAIAALTLQYRQLLRALVASPASALP